MADQRTIARNLNLSAATVCRSLKDDEAIHPETRAKVKAMAEQIGYRTRGTRARPSEAPAPGPFESGLTHVGALIVSASDPRSPHHAVWNRVMIGMSQAASSLRASLHVAYAGVPTEVAHPETLEQIPMLAERAVGGLVLMGQFSPDAIALLAGRFPCVRLVQHEPDGTIDCVNHDDFGAAIQLVRRLRALGHRRIGFATCDSIRERSYVQSRYGGYVVAMAEAGLSHDPVDRVGIDRPATHDDAADAIADAVGRGVTAWVCVHDGMGYEVMRRLADRGVRVPEDVSLCGFDDFDAPAGLPKLMSVGLPFESMGMAAVHRLLHRMRHPAVDPVQIMFPARLVEGLSTRQL